MLVHRVKFPLLEYVAIELCDLISPTQQITFIKALYGRPESGSAIIAGKMLQMRLPDDLPQAFSVACQGIIQGDTWYHCDHIGERIYGHGLITKFDEALPLLTEYLNHDNSWMQRSEEIAALGKLETIRNVHGNIKRLVVQMLAEMAQ